MQFNLFPQETKWTPPQDFPELTGEVALDLEGKDDGLRDGLGPGWPWRGGYVTGVSLAWGEPGREEARYYPVRQDGGGNLPVNAVMGWLKEQVAKPDVHLTLANAPYDLGWLRTEGIFIDRPVDDVQVMVPLLDEHRFSYGLDAIGKDFLGEQKDEALLIQACKDFGLIPKNATTKAAKNNMWRLPAKYIGPYAEQDARLTLRLKRHLLPLLEADDVLNAYGVERELQLLLVDMRARGIRVDLPHVERSIRRCDEQELVLLQELKRLTGRRLGAWDEGLGEALAQAGLPVPRTAPTRHKPQGSYSVTKEFLEEHKSHQLCQVIRNARRYDKGRSFLRSVQEHTFDGRLHAQFHPLKSDDGGAVTGRFSSTDPNLQQQPSPEKDPELGTMIRACYLPEEGEVWDAVDYSAQEPRLTVHYAYVAQKGGLLGAADAVAAYRSNPRTDYHQLVADMCGIARKPAKTINLGIAYGMGGAKLCHKLGLPTRWVVRNPNDRWGEAVPIDSELGRLYVASGGFSWEAPGPEGQALLDQYNEKVPFVSKLSLKCQKAAEQRGWIKKLGGGRCHFSRGPGERGEPPRKALNSLIQGSAAYQTKRAMVECWRRGLGRHVLLSMHDELGFSVPNRQVRRELVDIMENTTPLSVPVVVDVESGRSWGEARLVKEDDDALAA